MTKVLVVGKFNSVAHWTENVAAAFKDAGYETVVFAVNRSSCLARLWSRLNKATPWKSDNTALVADFASAVTRVRPTVVLFTHAFWSIPLDLYETLHAITPRPMIVGWVGDKFTEHDVVKARLMDQLYFTDTAFLEEAARFGFDGKCAYLPLAVDPELFKPLQRSRRQRLIFVANSTSRRQRVVSAVKRPITLYGKGWDGLGRNLPHEVHPRRISIRQVAEKYNDYVGVLNIMNEPNVTHGLNQRSFEPLACKTAVINDRMGDLELCFDPGKEMLVYDNVEQLNETYERMLRDVKLAPTVAEAGYRRVLAEHTYRHRVTTIENQVLR